jgi:predicted enzyme related to lactoylglutathione lyase
MTTRDHAPSGAPTWADLWTSDVDGSRRFYGELFGWEALAPDPNFGGYFMFSSDGVQVAGAMGDMGPSLPANDTWKIYLACDDAAKTLATVESEGGTAVMPLMEVGDAGIQSTIIDPTGATLGVWQAKEYPGFTLLDVPGAPSWFELHTRDYDRAVEFYRAAFGWETQPIPDTHEIRYSLMRNPEADGELAGIMDASSLLAEGEPSHWVIYWEVADIDATVAGLSSLGGSVLSAPESTPYGRIAHVADPAGARFSLRTR